MPYGGNIANSQSKHAIGVFPNRADAEQALSQLKDAGFPMAHVSVIAKDAGVMISLVVLK